MNPIVRMMKRYIKMPLKYALPLLFIGALVLASTTGCVSSTNPSPSASIMPTTIMPTTTVTVTSPGSVSTDYPATGRSKLVEAAVEYRRDDFNTKHLDTKSESFDVNWISNTTAQIHEVTKSTEDYTTHLEDFTITHFPSTAEATTYLTNNAAKYGTSIQSSFDPVIDYYKITGKTPTVYTMYTKDYFSLTSISQFDSLIVERNSTYTVLLSG